MPSQEVYIDESLKLWRSWLGFRQYIPSKHHHFGVKLFVLCDCDSGYISDFTVYTIKDIELVHDADLGISESVVKTLLAPHLQKGHVFYIDNWYSSPNLFPYLPRGKYWC